MIKALSALLISISFATFFCFSKQDLFRIALPVGNRESFSRNQSFSSRNSVLRQKKLHEAFEKILEKEKQADREPASLNERSQNSTQLTEDVPELPTSEPEDFEDQFSKLSLQDVEVTIEKLRVDIEHDEATIKRLEESRGENNEDEDTINKLEVVLKNNQDKRAFFLSKLKDYKE